MREVGEVYTETVSEVGSWGSGIGTPALFLQHRHISIHCPSIIRNNPGICRRAYKTASNSLFFRPLSPSFLSRACRPSNQVLSCVCWVFIRWEMRDWRFSLSLLLLLLSGVGVGAGVESKVMMCFRAAGQVVIFFAFVFAFAFWRFWSGWGGSFGAGAGGAEAGGVDVGVGVDVGLPEKEERVRRMEERSAGLYSISFFPFFLWLVL